MKAVLTLEDGFTLKGKSFTGEFETGGEVIFNTGMTGYQEVLTDPSYYGQMVCMTYPLIGNYGINPQDMESPKVHMRALLVKECCKQPSNWRASESLPDFLVRMGVPGIEGLDTRALTRHLRLNGAMRGIISTKDLEPESLRQKALALPTMEGQNLVPFVAAKAPYVLEGNVQTFVQIGPDGSYAWKGTGLPLLVYDFGVKWNILRLLAKVGFEPLAVPPSFSHSTNGQSGVPSYTMYETAPEAISTADDEGSAVTMNSKSDSESQRRRASIPRCSSCFERSPNISSWTSHGFLDAKLSSKYTTIVSMACSPVLLINTVLVSMPVSDV